MRKYLIGGAIVIALIMFSGALAVYVFSGLIMFVGMVALIESIGPLRWFVARTGSYIDLMIFGFSIYLAINGSVTVAMGITIAGLLFTVFYKPYLRNRLAEAKTKK